MSAGRHRVAARPARVRARREIREADRSPRLLAGPVPADAIVPRVGSTSLAVRADAGFVDRLREVSASELEADVRFERALFRRELYAVVLVALLVVARHLWLL